jgi:tRNA nucleotidyltransferase (CCA-adding enzyme)
MAPDPMRRLRRPAALLPALRARLTERERAALHRLGAVAGAHGSGLYLVGGSVRDLLLGRRHLDLDFVVETDAIRVARAFARAAGARVVAHEAFRTAVVTAADVRFDLVTARREVYPAPGALPVVTPATLADDLARRDFTINAMALTAAGPAAGTLIDPHGGRADLAAGVLRVLHERSFQDDATRLWRAGRYVARLGLRLDPETERLAHRDRDYLDTISPARIHHEIERVLDEARPERALRWLDELGILRATFPCLACTSADAAAFPRLRRLAPREPHAAAIALLALDWEAATIAAGADRLDLDRRERTALRALPALRAALADLTARRAPPGEATERLDRLPEATIAAFAARYQRRRAGRLAYAYLDRWRHIHPLISAARLQELGVPFGPRLGEMLRLLRAARLNGVIASLDDEERLVHSEIGRTREGSPGSPGV